MKKFVASLLAICLILVSVTALAESVEAQLANIVRATLDQEDIIYDYDDEVQYFSMEFPLDSALGDAVVEVFLYDDMVSVTVDSPITVREDLFEKAAVFLTLVNSEIYYAQFRLDRDSGMLSCRSCNVIEGTLPAQAEIETLLYMPIVYMERYGDGIVAVTWDDADPYEAFESCQAALEED